MLPRGFRWLAALRAFLEGLWAASAFPHQVRAVTALLEVDSDDGV